MTGDFSSGVVAVAVALVVTLAATPPLIRWLTSRGLLDRESRRTSHTGTVPRGGGLALMAGTMLAFVATSASDGGAVWIVVSAAVAFGVLGLTDDLHSMSALLRLVVQFVLAVGTVTGLVLVGSLEAPGSVPRTLWAIGAVLWITGFVNAFNFMDGINGISVGTASVITAGLVIASSQQTGLLVPLGFALIGSCLGFARYNAWQGRVFLGDVGSYFLGSAVAILPLVAVDEGAPLAVVVFPFLVYVCDVGYTLFRRALRRESLWQSHREHIYQYLVNTLGFSHGSTAALVVLMTTALVALGQMASRSTPLLVTSCVATSAMLMVYVALPRGLGRLRAPTGEPSREPDPPRASTDDPSLTRSEAP